MFPETVGRSLEEVEEIFQQGHTFSAWKIGKDVGKKTLAEVVEKSKDIPVSKKLRCSLFVLLALIAPLLIQQDRKGAESPDEKRSAEVSA
jgi:hypothetical protein